MMLWALLHVVDLVACLSYHILCRKDLTGESDRVNMWCLLDEECWEPHILEKGRIVGGSGLLELIETC